MPLPADYNTVPVRGKYTYLDGVAAQGAVKFTGKGVAVSDTYDTVILPVTITKELEGDGSFEVNLPATNDPDILPNGFTYKVEEVFTRGGGRTFEIDVPLESLPDGIDLSSVAPLPPSAGDPTAFVTLTAFEEHTHAPTSGGGGTGGLPTPVLFNVEDFGAVGDGTTDDGPAILEAWETGVATGQDFYLVFPRAVEYLVDVDELLTPSTIGQGQYAAFKIPLRQNNASTHKQLIGVVGPGQACSTRVFPGDGNDTQPVTNTAVIKVAYSSAPSFHATHGWPSLFGGPDADRNGAFSNVHFFWKGVTIRQPPNPAMACLNLEGVATCFVEDFFADVTGSPDDSPMPTHPTGASILWPKNANAATLVGGRVGAWGYYAGPGFGEHLVLNFAYALRCIIGHPIRGGLGHAATITWTTTEECTYTIAGYNGETGVVPIPSGGNDPTILMGLSIEDFGYGAEHDVNGAWYYASDNGTNIYDPNNVLRGRIYFERSDASPSGDGATTQLLAKGASNVSLFSLRGGDVVEPVQQWVDPVPPDATEPDAPTIGVASAGDTTASVAFTPPVDNGGASITGYTATSTPGGLTGTGSSSPITVSGLTNGVAYTFKVYATNPVGDSLESAASNSVTPDSTPATTVAADSFNRTDGVLGTSSGGQVWSILGGTWGIVSNTARNSANGSGAYDVAVVDCGASLVTYTIKLTPNTGAIDLGLAALVQDIDNFVFWDLSGDGSGAGTTRLFHRNAGTFNGLTASEPITLTPGVQVTLKMVIGATSVQCYMDDDLVFASSGATGLEAQTKFGIVSSTGASDHGSAWDDLLITD